MDVKTFAREVETHIRPATFPVVAKLLGTEEPVPEKAKRPWRDMKVQIAICQAIAMARRYGWTVAVGAEDLNCVLTKTAFGLAPLTEHYTEGHLACGMYVATAEAGARTEQATHRLPAGKYKHLVVGPAARADFVPDALVIYGNAAQLMRLVTGALWKRGGAITSSFTGRIDCSDEIIRTAMTGEYQVISATATASLGIPRTRRWRFRCLAQRWLSWSKGSRARTRAACGIQFRAFCALRLNIQATTTSWSASGPLTLPQSQGRRHCGDLGESIQPRSS
jgi:uncharacterized protein (DUF169 family)